MKVEFNSTEKKRLVEALQNIGSTNATDAANGSCFRANFLGSVVIASAGGGGTLVEAHSRLVKSVPQGSEAMPAIIIVTDDNVIGLHQFDHSPITSEPLDKYKYFGSVGSHTNIFACIRQEKLGYMLALFFTTDDKCAPILQSIHKSYSAAGYDGAKKENPVDIDVKSGIKRRMSIAGGMEDVSKMPWFVGNASSSQVEQGLENGMVGDFVVRASTSTKGAYVLCVKLSPTEFIQQKITKSRTGMYSIDGKKEGGQFSSLSKLIEAEPKAKRPAAATVTGEPASAAANSKSGVVDARTDVKAFDALYLGCQFVLDKRVQNEVTPAVGKEVVKRCVVENSNARSKMKATIKPTVPYDVIRQESSQGTVMDENPVALVLTPKHVRIVERRSGQIITETFIRQIPFTLEAPGRTGGFDKFAFITKDDNVSQVNCHVFNVLPGDGHLLAEAISFYIELAERTYGSESLLKNPFAAIGGRIKAPKSLFAKQIHRADMKALKIIGAGQFGEVWLAEQAIKRSNGQVVNVKRAVKMLKEGGSESDRDEFVLESETMLNFDHDNVVRLVGVAVQQMPWLAVLEFMQYGDLRGMMKVGGQKKVTLAPGEFLDLCLQTASGCGYINSLRLVHMDIAARNCLVGANNRVKLADFGLTRAMDEGQNYYRLAERLTLSIKWTAVEALEKKCFNEKSDVWSFGIVCWECFTYGELPFKMVPINRMNAHLRKGHRLPQPDNCPNDIWAMIMNCWEADVAKRYNFERAKAAISKLMQKYKPPTPRRDIGKLIKETQLSK